MGEIFSFGVWVRRRRKALDLTQDALARRVGCALSMIRKIEADERKPSRQIAALLADALEVPATEREQFLQAARAERAVDQLAAPPLPSALELSLGTLPTGTVTFLFTDIAGSTRLWEQHPTAMQPALARHDGILRDAIAAHGGTLVKGTGDGLHAAFARATDAIHAALAAQRVLTAEDWGAIGLPRGQSLRVRMALHIGVTEERSGDYFGPVVNRAARLLAVGHGGQILLSHAMCDVVRDHLPPGAALRDLGAHRLKDLSREEQIWQLTVPDLPADFPPLASLSKRRHNLPIQLTSFVGRENELAAIARLLDGTHLLTLTGPGGTGKTRLSLQVAAELLTTFPTFSPAREPSAENDDRFLDGVWLVELAPLADPALVPRAVASALDLREDAGRPLLATLTDFLRGKNLLLIIDNCEHVVDACAQLAETVLRACPRVRILASSREALGIAGEVAWRVPPLGLPPLPLSPAWERGTGGEGDITRYESIQLFVERAAAARPDFTLTLQNASAVAQLCQRLDGIPLAIELAAARLRVLTVEQIAARLDDRFRLLTGGSRTALPRHQTLQALIDWSYDLLSDTEQVLLRRLAVFAGGWTLEAAEAVASELSIQNEELKKGQSDDPFSILNSQFSILDGLGHLVDKSLVVVDQQGNGARYNMLETIRQYAAERLAKSGEKDAVQRQHAEYCLLLAKASKLRDGAWHNQTKAEYDSRDSAWHNQMEAEHDNLRAALSWSLDRGEVEWAGQLSMSLEWFWFARGHISEGRVWLETLLARTQTTLQYALLRAVVSRMAGYFAYFQGDYGPAKALFETSLSLFQRLGDGTGAANLLINLGMVAEAQGENAHAQGLFAESLSLRQEIGDEYTIADSLYHLGRLALLENDDMHARTFLEESLSLFQALGSSGMIPIVKGILGYTLLSQREVQQAAISFSDALGLLQRQGNTFIIPYNLIGLAGVLGVQRHTVRAAKLIGAAEGLGETSGLRPSPGERALWERIIAPIRAQLDDAAFAAAWAGGQQLTLEDAVAEALAEL